MRDTEVIILIDSGATHNFISNEIVQRLEISLSHSASYGVVLGTGDSVRAAGVCKNVVLTMGDITIVQDFLPLPLGSADIILSVAWLETLGKIQFDYRLSVMDFQLGEWQVHLKGDRGLVKSHISLKSMMRTIHGGDQAVLIELNSLEFPRSKKVGLWLGGRSALR